VFALVAVAVTLAAPDRFGITVDSGEYLGVAKGLLHGHGLTMAYSNADEAYRVPSGAGQTTHLTQFPPLFPLLIAFVAYASGTSAYVAAIVVNTTAFAWAAARLSVIALRRSALAVVAMSAALLSVPVIEPALMVWAEPLKLAFLVEGALALAVAARENRTRSWVRLGVIALLATATHFTGVAIAVAAVLLLLTRKTRRPSLLVVAVAGTTAPVAGWLVYSNVVGGGLGQKTLGFHPPVSIAALVACVGLAALGLGLVASRTDDRVQESLLAVAFGLLLTILASRTFVDRNISLDRRQLQAVVVLAVAGALLAWPRTVTMQRSLAVLAAAAVVAGPLVTAVRIRHVMRSEWAGYRADRWRTSPLLHAVETSPSGTWVLSNAPDAIALLTTVRPIGLPAATNLYTGAPNRDYARELGELRCAVAPKQPRLAFFFRPTRGHSRSPDPVMLEQLRASSEMRFPDGVEYILDTSGCGAP
jgi:hypothetical protein